MSAASRRLTFDCSPGGVSGSQRESAGVSGSPGLRSPGGGGDDAASLSASLLLKRDSLLYKCFKILKFFSIVKKKIYKYES